MSSSLPDGVFLGLPEEEYFKDKERLGSTDLCRLFLRGEGYWWASEMNPDYVPPTEDNAAKVYGKALHAITLEGKKAYRERFAIVPTKDEIAEEHGAQAEGGKFCVTVGDIEQALERRGMNPKRMKKPELIAFARTRAPDLVIWDVLQEDWAKQNKGKLSVSSAEDRQLQIIHDLVREHPDIGELFKPGPDNLPLAEVSVLYTDEHGLKRRIRYDDLLPMHLIDLKTVSNLGQRPLAFSVGDHVGTYAYPCQLADHQYGRRWMMRMIAAGQVHGGTRDQRAWLSRFPTEAPPTAEYAWIFIQRPDSKNGQAPIVFPWVEDHGSDLHMDGIRMRRKAISTYLRCMALFGADQPWTRVEPAHTTAEGATNRVYLPSWIAQEQVPGEEEDL